MTDDRIAMKSGPQRIWRWFTRPRWTPARLRAHRTGAYLVRSAEGARSDIAIRKLGRAEYERQKAELIEKLREQNRGR